jgi:hypothetical protein
MLLTDEASNVTSYIFLKKKNEAFEHFVMFKKEMERQYGKAIKILQSDCGGEFASAKFQSYLRSEGIQWQHSVAYTPEQNGRAERKNRTIFDTARTLLLQSGLPFFLWPEAVKTAVYLRNRLPSRSTPGKTPYEVLTGKRPNLSHLRIFGCDAYAHIPKEKRKGSLGPRSKKLIFVGYDTSAKGYRLVDPAANYRSIVVARDVTFNEAVFRREPDAELNEGVDNIMLFLDEEDEDVVSFPHAHEVSDPSFVESAESAGAFEQEDVASEHCDEEQDQDLIIEPGADDVILSSADSDEAGEDVEYGRPAEPRGAGP